MEFNSLFVEWLQEWADAMKNPKLKFVYLKAMNAIKGSNEKFYSALETEKLKGIGPKLSKRLQDRLQQYCTENGLADPTIQVAHAELSNQLTTNEDAVDSDIQRKEKRKRTFVPHYGSSQYALLLGLLLFPNGATKSQLSVDAKRFYRTLDQSAANNIWNGMLTLISHELVVKDWNLYILSATGDELARKLAKIDPDAQILAEADNSKYLKESSIENYFMIKRDSYQVKLVIDCREVKQRSTKILISEELQRRSFSYLTEPLEIGDFIWIAEDQKSNRAVLDFIVERKRTDDLISSIIDGRYEEQKFRLRKSGIRHIFYVIENLPGGSSQETDEERVNSAIISTLVRDGFHIRRTSGINETIDFIVNLSEYITRHYFGIDLIVFTERISHEDASVRKKLQAAYGDGRILSSFKGFMFCSRKESSLVNDIYLKQLLCLHQVTPEKALAVKSAFPTMNQYVIFNQVSLLSVSVIPLGQWKYLHLLLMGMRRYLGASSLRQ